MRLINRIAGAQLLVAMAALLTMGAVTVADVFLKYVFSRPIAGAYDLVECLLPVVVFYGLPTTLLRRQSIVIDLVDHAVRPAWIKILKAVSDIVVLALLIAIALAFLSPARAAFDYGDRKIELGLPLWVVWTVVLIGICGAIVAAVANAVRGLRPDGSTSP
jgi:TRAP-type C4-dicarboxylate transport system permease small subunit